MLAELVREFCNVSENRYRVYENYSGRNMFGRKTIGIVVPPEHNFFQALAELNSFIEEKEFDESVLAELCDELEATSVDELGLDMLIYFPMIRDYRLP